MSRHQALYFHCTWGALPVCVQEKDWKIKGPVLVQTVASLQHLFVISASLPVSVMTGWERYSLGQVSAEMKSVLMSDLS